MSGGYFEYDQYRINDIADKIEDIIERNNKIIPYEDLDDWDKRNYNPNNPPKYWEYPSEVIAKFKEGLDILHKASIYAQRIDWLICGDDGENTFLERLNDDLKEYETNKTKL